MTKRKPPKRAPEKASACPSCGCTWPKPHAETCTAVKAMRQRMAAVREAWADKKAKTPAAKPERVRPKHTEEDGFADTQALLRVSLELAVPLWVQRFRDERRTLESLRADAREVGTLLGSQGTALMWRAKGEDKAPRDPDGTLVRERAVSTREMFNRLAAGIAAASFCPGGIKAFGVHFESKPEWLEGAHG